MTTLLGVKVLDLSRLLPGPFCTMLLADMGADVIKIEHPQGGDYARYQPPLAAAQGEMGAFFSAINRNKRSLTLDLKQEEGAQILRDLAVGADVLVESFRPGVMDRLGLGPEALMELNPELIYCSISGYGQDGPMARRAGHDLNYIARAGVLDRNGPRGQAPTVPGVQIADLAGGALYAALGISTALYARCHTGQGRHIDISMTEGALSLMIPTLAQHAAGHTSARGDDVLTGGLPCYDVYRTADGRYLGVGALEPKFWMGFVQAIGAPELAGDGLSGGERGEEVRRQVARALEEKTLAQWQEIFEACDVCVEPVLTPEEVLRDEMLRAREMFFELSGVQHCRTPLTPRDMPHEPAPTLGQHTTEILEVFGLGEEAVAKLREKGVV